MKFSSNTLAEASRTPEVPPDHHPGRALKAGGFLATCALAAALTSGMALFPVLLAAGALIATALLAGVVAGVVGAPWLATLTYRWAVRDAERAERRARRLASFPVIGAYAIATPPAEAVAQARLLLDAVTAAVELER